MKFTKLAKQKAYDETPVPVELVDRAGAPMLSQDGKPWTWYVRGEYSEAGRRHARQVHDRVRAQIRVGDFDVTYEDSEQAALDKILALTDRFENIDDDEGTPVPFTRQNAEEILRAADWFVPQIKRRIERHANFSVKASAS